MTIPPYIQRLREAVGSELLMVPSVIARVRNQAGEVLLIQRSDNGVWDFPGGMIDPGETPAAAILREVREETGLDVRIEHLIGVLGGATYRHTYPGGDVVEPLLVIFACRLVDGELKIQSGEIDDARFFAPEALSGLMPPYPDWVLSDAGPGFEAP